MTDIIEIAKLLVALTAFALVFGLIVIALALANARADKAEKATARKTTATKATKDGLGQILDVEA